MCIECLLISNVIHFKIAPEGSGPNRCLLGCRTIKMVCKCSNLLSQLASPTFPDRRNSVLRLCNLMSWVSCFVACACWAVQPGLPQNAKSEMCKRRTVGTSSTVEASRESAPHPSLSQPERQSEQPFTSACLQRKDHLGGKKNKQNPDQDRTQ